MKKSPYEISNYEELVEDGYEYVDKTMYIEKLEKLNEKRIMFLRPRKLGKTLFTSVIENYYDKLKIDKFEKLFEGTYIGKNPTKLKNSYNILRFNFSGIDTTDATATIKGFREKVEISIKSFINKYKIDFIINPEQTTEGMLRSLFEAFIIQKPGEKIYVIIDEKYVKIIFYSIAMNLKIFSIRSELEVNRKYTDLLITPRDVDKCYKSVLIEFKYLKKEEEDKLKEKQEEAKEQLKEYEKLEEIAKIKDLRKYTIVTVLDKMHVEEI